MVPDVDLLGLEWTQPSLGFLENGLKKRKCSEKPYCFNLIGMQISTHYKQSMHKSISECGTYGLQQQKTTSDVTLSSESEYFINPLGNYVLTVATRQNSK